jgi:fumarate hydratase subunit alpha
MEGVRSFVLETVEEGGAESVSARHRGGRRGRDLRESALLSKKALLGGLGTPNERSPYAEFEKRLLADINGTGIGPAGLGDASRQPPYTSTYSHAYRLHTVAVNICCHASRHARVSL